MQFTDLRDLSNLFVFKKAVNRHVLKLQSCSVIRLLLCCESLKNHTVTPATDLVNNSRLVVFLSGSCFWVEVFWVAIFRVAVFRVAIFLGGSFPGGNFPGWQFSSVATFRVAIFLGGNYPGGNLPGGNYPGGNLPGGNFLGGNFPDTEIAECTS